MLGEQPPTHQGAAVYSRKVSKHTSKVHRLASGKRFGQLNRPLVDDLRIVFQRSRTESPRPRPAPLGVFGVIVYG